MKKQKSMMEYMKSRASIGAPKNNLGGGGDDEIKSKKLEVKPLPKSDFEDEMVGRKYASSPNTKETDPTEVEFKSKMKQEFDRKDKDLKNALDKSLLQSKVKYLESREEKLGGRKALTKKIKRREFARKAAPWVAGTVIGAGVGKMVYDEIQRQKKAREQ